MRDRRPRGHMIWRNRPARAYCVPWCHIFSSSLKSFCNWWEWRLRWRWRLNQNKKKRESIKLLVHTALVPHIFIIIVDNPGIWQCQHFATCHSEGSVGKKLNSDKIYPNIHLLWELGAVKLENGLLGWKELGWGDVVCGKTCDPCYWECGHFESDVSTKLSMEMDSK